MQVRSVFAGVPDLLIRPGLGFCKRGAGCWFLHTTDGREPGTIDEDDEELCSICFDKPHTYGLLGTYNDAKYLGSVR